MSEMGFQGTVGVSSVGGYHDMSMSPIEKIGMTSRIRKGQQVLKSGSPIRKGADCLLCSCNTHSIYADIHNLGRNTCARYHAS